MKIIGIESSIVEKLIAEHQLLKFQISSTKYQINPKPQHSTRGASACAARDQNIEEVFTKSSCLGF
jgi:hypothetical protein